VRVPPCWLWVGAVNAGTLSHVPRLRTQLASGVCVYNNTPPAHWVPAVCWVPVRCHMCHDCARSWPAVCALQQRTSSALGTGTLGAGTLSHVPRLRSQLASGGELMSRLAARHHYSEKDAATIFRAMVEVRRGALALALLGQRKIVRALTLAASTASIPS